MVTGTIALSVSVTNIFLVIIYTLILWMWEIKQNNENKFLIKVSSCYFLFYLYSMLVLGLDIKNDIPLTYFIIRYYQDGQDAQTYIGLFYLTFQIIFLQSMILQQLILILKDIKQANILLNTEQIQNSEQQQQQEPKKNYKFIIYILLMLLIAALPVVDKAITENTTFKTQYKLTLPSFSFIYQQIFFAVLFISISYFLIKEGRKIPNKIFNDMILLLIIAAQWLPALISDMVINLEDKKYLVFKAFLCVMLQFQGVIFILFQIIRNYLNKQNVEVSQPQLEACQQDMQANTSQTDKINTTNLKNISLISKKNINDNFSEFYNLSRQTNAQNSHQNDQGSGNGDGNDNSHHIISEITHESSLIEVIIEKRNNGLSSDSSISYTNNNRDTYYNPYMKEKIEETDKKSSILKQPNSGGQSENRQQLQSKSFNEMEQKNYYEQQQRPKKKSTTSQ